MSPRTRPALLSGLLAVTLATALTGCTGTNSLGDQAQRGDNKGFIAGDGTIETIPADKRAAAVRLEGTLLDGTPWKLGDHKGKVVVVNVWGSWCAPCEAEMPLLQKTWTTVQEKHPDDVRFLGVDTGESAQTGAAAVRRYGLTYPSLSDQNRTVTAGLQGKASATPTTLVLDRQGRIATRISGQVTGETTLLGLVQDVVAER